MFIKIFGFFVDYINFLPPTPYFLPGLIVLRHYYKFLFFLMTSCDSAIYASVPVLRGSYM